MEEPERFLILASSSPRRRVLLREAGFEFRIAHPEVEETRRPGEAPASLAQRLALLKADFVARTAPPQSCVLAADTLVVLGDRVLGKPLDRDDAARMLLSLAGRVHRVLTGYALLIPGTDHRETGISESLVHIGPVTPEQAADYAAGGESLDKAGSYALQGEGRRFVEQVEGSRSNVIGLPLEAVLPRLSALGVRACTG